ncbi:Eco57I restriction-modification methylase domain-containing protein [Vampirovibrio sp.]|uniref:Eco57I restriction-modification methylase domain-containing protein n=1 Tax=Vampirovibrio sp. TaxID=2717857 RepID=UPI003594301A
MEIRPTLEIDALQGFSIPSNGETDAASRAYEQSLPEAFRSQKGQFYTPQTLCDFMLALASQSRSIQRILEPACGSGNFLRRALTQASQQGHLGLELVGVEQNPDALQFAQDLSESTVASVSLLADNFLTLQPKTMPPFELIIGNPPYVRQELFGQSSDEDKLNLIKNYALLFADYVNQYPEQHKLFSQKADLYQWFFLQAHPMLSADGILAYVVSNSWLNSVFGHYLRQFISHHFHWLYMVESACERWFEDAAINPVIVILQKKKSAQEPAPSPCSLVRLHQPLSSWLPEATAPNYWQQLSLKIQQLPQDPTVSLQTFSPSQWAELDKTGHWNLAFRAPQALLEVASQPQLWKALNQLGHVRYPLKTGINAFFYLSKAQAKTRGIEPEFLAPVIRSVKKMKTLKVTANEQCDFLFCCPLSKTELKARGKTGALRYIEWGEGQSSPPRQKRLTTTPWPQIPSVRNNHPWYSLQALATPHLLCNRFIDQRFFFALCQDEFMEDQIFYGLTLHHPQQHPPDLIAALLNSTLGCALLEFKGRASLGEGVLQFARCDMADFPILDPDLYTPTEQKSIRDAFQLLAESPLQAWSQCHDHPYRIALDRAVLTPLHPQLNLSKSIEEFRTELALSILNRVQERKEMAQSVRNKAKKKAANAAC